MSEIRKDPLTGRGVIIAPERARRPKQLGSAAGADLLQACPFCPGNEHLTPPESWADRPGESQPDQPGWSVRIVPNKYPAVAEIDFEVHSRSRNRLPGAGVHEVIIESAPHVVNMAALDEHQLTRIFHAYRERLRTWREDPRWQFRLIFKNQGEHAGATFEHAHAQLIALPLVPADVETELDGARAYYRRSAKCYYCAQIEREVQTGARIVMGNDKFIAFCPQAPRFAFETWILPRIHADAFEASNDESVAALAKISRRVIAALDHLQANPPFNFFIQSLSLNESDQAHYHWQLRLLPQISRAAGFEWGSGMHINPVAPELAAQMLRDAAI